MESENSDYTPIPENSNNSNLRLVNFDEFQAHKKDFNKQKTLLSWTNGFLVTILIVVLMSFITFLVDSWRFHSEKLEEFNNIVKTYNQQMDSIKYNIIEKRIQKLENKKR
jgi:hypothetical protein